MLALILAGGLGKRLRSVVDDRPKPMAGVGGRPFLEYQLEFLKRYGINRLVLCVGYLYHQIEDYFGDGSRWDLHIDYAIENTPLGTAGALKNARRFVNATFLTLNGDTFFNINLSKLIQYHQSNHATDVSYLGSLALTKVDNVRSYGSVQLDPNNYIASFLEKKEAGSNHNTGSNLVNAGIYVLEPEIMDFIQEDRKVSLEMETFPAVLENGNSLGGYKAEGLFIDIGTPEGYYKLRDYITGRKI
jgi:mannose-1-phosphate guanylyltransferase